MFDTLVYWLLVFLAWLAGQPKSAPQRRQYWFGLCPKIKYHLNVKRTPFVRQKSLMKGVNSMPKKKHGDEQKLEIVERYLRQNICKKIADIL